MKKIQLISISLFVLLTAQFTFGQSKKDEKPNLSSTLEGFKFRSIGPAFMSGRIADIAIDPKNENTWYVAVGSGGVWKTTNAGTTWEAITENLPFYSTGCITIDPNNNSSIWLGTGENVGGRHVGIGHGIYHSKDGGKTWKDMGLKKSEHISKIIVHPTNPNIIWVAAQGPLWSSGGERGLYKTIDGGKTWKNTLEINEWTGATDLVIDPKNPNVLYAATWQRHRNVAVLMGGGPGSGIYKSVDGGNTWNKINKGISGENKGKIGLAISPMDSDVLYAAVELEKRKGAIYRTENKGENWSKMSETVSGGTGPHYYQELVASPFEFDKIYLMNVRMLVSENGGKTFYTMSEKEKHSDNHSLTFKKNDPNYMLVGTDGGIYESFDQSKHWKYIGNLPITQFYKLAVDDALPFYNIYGGTQDNNTQTGPSRTVRSAGITNSDWEVILGGDGHQPATEPGNPNIVYAQWQQGNINRIDRTNGETVYIKPQAGANEPKLRFNWDSPILISQHDPKRIYFGSQKVWKSENRGDSWKSISGDLTKDQERFALPVMGKTQSIDNAWDVYAMSTYNTITSLAESKLNENILYAGTDDGIIQSTKDGGKTWTKTNVESLPGVPSSAFVNDIKADLYDEHTAYVVLDNHKFGDYSPYIYMTKNGGKTWESISNGIPENTITWRIVQDHKKQNILFLGTEYGVYVSLNQGKNWNKFSTGIPTIPVRDLTIQIRENDLVIATFGRGFYILDDYSALREINEKSISENALLFAPRKALQYNQMRGGTSSGGSSGYVAKNPPYGAVITYYLKESFVSKKAARQKSELPEKLNNGLLEKLKKAGYLNSESILDEDTKTLAKRADVKKEEIDELKTSLESSKTKDIVFPGWEKLDAEKQESKASAILIVKNSNGEIVTQLQGPLTKGMNQVNWNLMEKTPTLTMNSRNRDIYKLAEPGSYNITLYQRIEGKLTQIAGPKTLEVERIRKGTLTNPMTHEQTKHEEEIIAFTKLVNRYSHQFGKANKKLETYKNNLEYLTTNNQKLTNQVYELIKLKNQLNIELNGSPSKNEVGEKTEVSITNRLWKARGPVNSYGASALHMESLWIAKALFNELQPKMDAYLNLIEKLGTELQKAGAPEVLD